jgi:hypothetical protein
MTLAPLKKAEQFNLNAKFQSGFLSDGLKYRLTTIAIN